MNPRPKLPLAQRFDELEFHLRLDQTIRKYVSWLVICWGMNDDFAEMM
jgi:hypothetical protein